MSALAIRYHLLLVPPTVVFKARVNQATFTNAAAQITFDGVTVGAYTDIQPEMLVLIGTTDGADDLGRVRVRKAATSSVLYVGWASRGTGEGEAYWQDDAYITVLDLTKPWTKNPRITSAGVNYTDFDRDFATYGALPPVIVLGCGTAVQQPLDSVTDEATFTFDASGSYATDAQAGVISAWSWVLPAAATLTAGAIDSDTVTFTAPVGAYWVSVTGTDDNATATTRQVLCVAGEPTGTLTTFDQVEITRRAEGQTLRVRVSESIPAATYPKGCLAVLWITQTADGVAVTPSGLSGHEHLMFVGWHYQHDMNGRAGDTGFIDDTVLEFRDLGGWMQVLPGYPMVVQRKSAPTQWTEMRAADIDRYFIRLLAEYSNMLRLSDFAWSGLGDTYPFPALQSDGQTLYEQVNGRAGAIVHLLTCDQWGRLAVYPNPMLIDPAGGTATPITRTATVQKAFTDADYTDLTYTEQPFPRLNWIRASGIVAAALGINQISKVQTVWCTAPGRAPSQGTATLQVGEQLVTGQDELNARIGHQLVMENRPILWVEWTHTSPDHFAIQPATMEWVTLVTSAATAGARGRVFSDRLLPIELTISHDGATGAQTVRTRAQPETSGTPAQTYVPPADDPTPDEPVIPPIEEPGTDYDLGPGLQQVFLIHASGELSLTSDFQTPGASGGPTYTVVDLSLVGTVLDAVTDPYSPLYVGTGTTVNAWIVTTERIYRVTDVAAISSRVVTSQHTFAAASDYRTIQTERGVQNWVMVASYYIGAGQKTAYTTNGGTTWTEVLVSSATLGTGSTYQPPAGIDIAFTGESIWQSDLNYTVAPIQVTVIANGLGIRLDWTCPAGSFKNQSSRWPLTHNGMNISSLKIQTQEVSGFGIPTEPWYTYWFHPGDYSPDLNMVGYFQQHATPTPIAGGYELAYGWGSNRQCNSFGGLYRATPQSAFPGGHFVWDMIITEINGTSTLVASAPVAATPTLYVSGHTPGLAYVGAVTGAAGDLYRTRDYGATWSAPSMPAHDFATSLGLAFHSPWHDNPDDLHLWSGQYDAGVYASYRANGATLTDVSPAVGVGPAGPKAWATSALNRQVVVLMAHNGSEVTGYRSDDGGTTWTTIQATTGRINAYVGAALADDAGTLYVWGPRGVGYSSNAGLVIDDRIGSGSASEVVCIGGW